MDESKYLDTHIHPMDPTPVEMVAYECRDGGWDVFVVEPVGSCPELEDLRVDERHLFIKHVNVRLEVEGSFSDILNRLGIGYQREVFFREADGRRTIERLVEILHRNGVYGMGVQSTNGKWELVLRRKNFDAGQSAIQTLTDGAV
jgi:hypothetical protein